LLQQDGAGTILDYVGLAYGDVASQFRKAFTADHSALLQRTVPRFEQGPLLVTHDGRPERTINEVMSGERQRESLGKLAVDGRFSVFGHYPQQSRSPLVLNNLACLDTGAGGGGPLTAFLWPERAYIQR
jgi:hypothetical protein